MSDYITIPLFYGPQPGAYALVDAQDADLVLPYRWQLQSSVYGTRYAIRFKKRNRVSTKFYMHREILGAAAGLEVDHINGNGLDNRRQNLRLVSHQENMMNRAGSFKTSRYKGVHRDRARNKWAAKIKHNQRIAFIGRFDDEIEAACAYDVAARLIFGRFAWCNFDAAPPLIEERVIARLAETPFRSFLNGGAQ